MTFHLQWRKSVLLTCREISQNQPITDLWINELHCDTSQVFPNDVFNLSRTAESITIANSTLPINVFEDFLSQLPHREYLTKLHLQNVRLNNHQAKSSSQKQVPDKDISSTSFKMQSQGSESILTWDNTSQTQSKLLHSLKKRKDNTFLQKLILINCSVSEDICLFISKCQNLTHLNLSCNRIRESGIHIVKGIENMGLESPLESLYLRNCSIPSDICGEIIKCLSQCKHLKHLDLGGHDLSNHGKHLSEIIKNIGANSPLQTLCLRNCSMPEEEWTEVLECLPSCRHLTQLDLSENKLGKAGKYIAETIEITGLLSSLELLFLKNCSIPNTICTEILKCLSKCIHLMHLDLGGNKLGHQGKYLAKIIKNIGTVSPLQSLGLQNCSIPEVEWIEVLKFLPSCRYLTMLALDQNKVGKAGKYIAETIESMRMDSLFKLLSLRNCSIPSDICSQILKCLSQCKHLTHLDIGGHDLRNQGKHIAEIVKNIGAYSQLQVLCLPNCFISEVQCAEILEYLPSCRYLTDLNLDGNKLGKAGKHIANTIAKMGLNSTLQLLHLRNCLIPSVICGEIIKCLPYCKHLTHLDLGGHHLGNQGKHIAGIIKNMGDDSPLEGLYLPNCSIPEVECAEILEYLPSCRHLTDLNMDGNKEGKSGMCIVKTIENMGLDSPLNLLNLRNCAIPNDICREIVKCLSQCKHLKHLDLGGHDLSNQGKHVAEIINNIGANSPLQKLFLPNCSIPEVEWQGILENLPSCTHLIQLDLSGNKVGKAGIHIVKTIENMGLDSLLELLYLRNCSIPSDISGNILKCLSQCKHLMYLDLGGLDLAIHRKHLADIINNIAADFPLQALYLPNCSIPEVECDEILENLPSFRHLVQLDLSGNKVGKAAMHIAKTIENMGLDSLLELLYLRNCSIPSDMCGDILKYLSQCKHLKHLDIGEHDLSNQGKHVAEIINNIGANSPLQGLYLPNCSIPEAEFAEILKNLPSCTHLIQLDLSGNKLGKAGMYIVKTIGKYGNTFTIGTICI